MERGTSSVGNLDGFAHRLAHGSSLAC
jgi:hypothetical protein